MSKRNNSTIGIKLGLGFLVVIAISGIIGGVAIWNMETLAARTIKLYRHPYTVSTNILEIEVRIVEIHRNMKDVALARTNAEIDAAYSLVADIEKDTLKHFDVIEDRFLGEDYMWKDAKKAFIDWKPIREDVVRNMKEGNREEAARITKTRGVEHIALISEKIWELEKFASGMADKFYNDSITIKRDTMFLMYGLIIVSIIAGITIAILITLSITRPLTRITRAANQIARGDLAVERVNIRSNDEIGRLADSFKNMTEAIAYKEQVIGKVAEGDLTVKVELASKDDNLGKSLRKMISALNEILLQVSTATTQFTASAGQVSSASQTLSQGASEQAASVEEISSSVTQMNSQTRQNAENAINANALAKKAMENAENGNGQMNELVLAMDEINKSSEEIKKVVKVIDDIAFQTNLLALNANVEAARAGKYGKGFAVVADEVRNLAAKSAKAVKETTKMVDDSIKSIETGSGLVESTSRQLDEIVNSVSKVADFIDEITCASKEQAEGLDQINSSIEQVSRVTQGNSANAEESASASEELAAQAEHLKSMLKQFVLDEKAGGSASSLLNQLTPELVEQLKNQLMIQQSAGSKNKSQPKRTVKQLPPAEIIVDDENDDIEQVKPEEIIALNDDNFEDF